MSRGDPIEFTRRLRDGDQLQRVGNRIQLEAFEIEADHIDSSTNVDTIVDLPPPGAGNHWRIHQVHLGFDAVPAATVIFTINDGTTLYQIPIATIGPHTLGFGRTRWASNGALQITLPAGGVGVTGYLAVLGARIERDIYS